MSITLCPMSIPVVRVLNDKTQSFWDFWVETVQLFDPDQHASLPVLPSEASTQLSPPFSSRSHPERLNPTDKVSTANDIALATCSKGIIPHEDELMATHSNILKSCLPRSLS